MIGYPSGKDGAILPARDTGFVPPYNKSFIDQACSVKMAGYWPRSFFFASLWTETSSHHYTVSIQIKPGDVLGGLSSTICQEPVPFVFGLRENQRHKVLGTTLKSRVPILVFF